MTEQTPSLSDEQIQDLLRVGNPTDEECRLIRMGLDAAMRKQPAPSAPEGWNLVPAEPTPEMVKAMEAQWMRGAAYGTARREYKAALSAAPEAKR